MQPHFSLIQKENVFFFMEVPRVYVTVMLKADKRGICFVRTRKFILNPDFVYAIGNNLLPKLSIVTVTSMK